MISRTFILLLSVFLFGKCFSLSRFARPNKIISQTVLAQLLCEFLSNLQSIPTDCPHREEKGWTGEAHLAAEQGIYNFMPAALYAKWLNDLNDEP